MQTYHCHVVVISLYVDMSLMSSVSMAGCGAIQPVEGFPRLPRFCLQCRVATATGLPRGPHSGGPRAGSQVQAADVSVGGGQGWGRCKCRGCGTGAG